MRLIATFAIVSLLLAACTTTSQVEDLEARIAELEQAAAVAATSTTTAATRDITGSLTTDAYGLVVCKIGTNQLFDDTPITIEDGSGATLAIGELSERNWTEEECTFTFTLPGVPADESFYRIRLGDTYWDINRVALEDLDWTADLDART